MNPRDWGIAAVCTVALVLFFHFVTSVSWQGSVLRAAIGLGAGIVAIGIRRTSAHNRR